MFLTRDLLHIGASLLSLGLWSLSVSLLLEAGIVPGAVLVIVTALVLRQFYRALTSTLTVDRPEDSGKITSRADCDQEVVTKCATAVEFLRRQSGPKLLPTFHLYRLMAISSCSASGGKLLGRMFGCVMVEERLALELETGELAAVLAHEMEHFESCDSLKGVLFSVISIAALIALPLAWLVGFLAGSAPSATALGVMLLTCFAVAALKNLWIYFAEYAADAGSVRLIGSPADLRSGLDKIRNFGLQPEIQSALYSQQKEIESGGYSRSFAVVKAMMRIMVPVVMFLMVNFLHPSLEKRYRALESFGRP